MNRLNFGRSAPFVPFRNGWSFGSMLWLLLVAAVPVIPMLWQDLPGERDTAAASTRQIRVPRRVVSEGRELIRRLEDWSLKNRDYAILVDKTAFTLALYLNGRRIAESPVELGREPVLAKEKEGDGRTPEGWYLVKRYLPAGTSSFYRALLIDYPNAGDWQSFRARQARGELAGARSPGDLIEIHGHGSGQRPGDGGANWTLGCVALSDADVDRLLDHRQGGQRVRVGTPVVIIRAGSLPDGCYEFPALP